MPEQVANPASQVPARQIRVTHLINSLESGGAEMALLRVASTIDRSKYYTSVISFSTVGPVGEKLLAAGIRVDALGTDVGRFSSKALIRLIKKLRHDRPDILMTWLVPSDFLGLLVCRIAKIPRLVWNIRNSAVRRDEIGARNAYLKKVSAKFSTLPKAVVVNSLAGLESHKSIGFHPRKWYMIPNGFDLSVFSPDESQRRQMRRELNIPEFAQVVGLIAHYRPAKNHQMFLKAAQNYSATHPEAHFVLAGRDIDAKNPNLKELCGPLWGDPRLHLLGEVSDIRRVLSVLDLMAMSSLFEGFPNAVGEAMAMGVPCVVTKTSGDAPRIVGEFGKVVESNDVNGFVAAWAELLNRPPEEFAELRKQVRQHIAEAYSLDAAVRRYSDLFDSLMVP